MLYFQHIILIKSFMDAKEITAFLDKIFPLIHKLGIDTSNLILDHIGYQTSSSADFDKIKDRLLQRYELAGENIVGG